MFDIVQVPNRHANKIKSNFEELSGLFEYLLVMQTNIKSDSEERSVEALLHIMGLVSFKRVSRKLRCLVVSSKIIPKR